MIHVSFNIYIIIIIRNTRFGKRNTESFAFACLVFVKAQTVFVPKEIKTTTMHCVS
jgi:hypothetical protein